MTTVLNRPRAKSAAKTQLLEQQGVLALAQITGITETGTRINDQPLVKLNLHVSGPGIAPFEAGSGHRVDDAGAQHHRPQARYAGRSRDT